jgi:hypothetical protein
MFSTSEISAFTSSSCFKLLTIRTAVEVTTTPTCVKEGVGCPSCARDSRGFESNIAAQSTKACSSAAFCFFGSFSCLTFVVVCVLCVLPCKAATVREREPREKPREPWGYWTHACRLQPLAVVHTSRITLTRETINLSETEQCTSFIAALTTGWCSHWSEWIGAVPRYLACLAWVRVRVRVRVVVRVEVEVRVIVATPRYRACLPRVREDECTCVRCDDWAHTRCTDVGKINGLVQSDG